MHSLDENIILKFDLDPLIDAIRNNKAIVYVGAGASKSAGLPDWETFLRQCLSKAKASYEKNANIKETKVNFELAQKLLDSGDYLMSAELLQQEIGSTLSTYIWDIFGTKRTPSSIHKAIARIPFSLAITTNYDKLLEGAYNKIPNVFTWLDPQAIFSSMKYNRFAVIKTHGDVGNDPSVVLTKTHYRNLMHLNKAFNEEIVSLLSLKTFLFIGSSLRDHDLLRLMDEARLTYNNNFGPHYAFLFKEEIDETFIRYLREAYNIHVIISTAKDTKTDSVCSFLKVVSGRVSEQNLKNSELVAINSELFCFNKIIHERMREILIQTGAEKGIVAFIDRRDLPGLKHFIKENIFEDKIYFSSVDSNGNLLDGILDENDSNHKKILTAFYLKWNKTQKYIYYPDITDKKGENNKSDIDDWDFSIQDTTSFCSTKSVLTTQIFSDGQIVGIILIESSIIDAFTVEHLKTLQTSTILLAAVFKELEFRNRPLYDTDLRSNAARFQQLMDSSYLLNGYDISYLFYEIDHRNGRLVAHYDPEIVKRSGKNGEYEEFFYNFDDESLATFLLKSQQGKYFEDVEDGVAEKIISQKGVTEFNIRGSIFATPIRVGMYNSFILVAWSRKGKFLKKERSLEHISASISRLAHLIANSTDRTSSSDLDNDKNRAKVFINLINNELKPIDSNKPWSFKLLLEAEKRNQLYKVLIKALTHEACNLARVRLWFYDEPKKEFRCIYSFSRADATMPGKKSENEYIKIDPTPATDSYCKFTLNRFEGNPYAMHQHKSMMSSIQDPNTEDLDKDPNGKWIVGPIVHRFISKEETDGKKGEIKSILFGFISADNHCIIDGKPKEVILTEKQDAFQRYAVDSISDLLVPLFRIHRFRTRYKFQKKKSEPLPDL